MNNRTQLIPWGWNDFLASLTESSCTPPLEPARIIGHDRKVWTIRTATGSHTSQVDPAAPLKSPPVVGDWVIAEPGTMTRGPWTLKSVLPRRSWVSSHEIGEDRTELILAANVDKIWFVHGLDSALNLERIRRYLEVGRESNAVPVLILTKRDVVRDVEPILEKVRTVSAGVQVHTVNAKDTTSIQALSKDFKSGETFCLVGQSGVGKSTLIRSLSPVGTETSIENGGIFQVPGGACLLDTKETREFRVWIMEEGLEDAFPDIDALAKNCRFDDCGHSLEAGCAVIAAVERGELDRQRLKNFRKLQADAAIERQGLKDDTPKSKPSVWDSLKKRMGRS